MSLRLRERRGTETRSLSTVPNFHDAETRTSTSQYFDCRSRRKACRLRHINISVQSAKENLLKCIQKLSESVRSALVPAAVREEYWRFMVWKNAQRCVASVMSTMATQVSSVRHGIVRLAVLAWRSMRCHVHRDGSGLAN